MQMNWRLLTAINAAIALVTVCAVIYMVTRSPGPKRASRESTRTRSETNTNSTSTRPDEQAGKKISIESPEDLTNARVDDLGAVPAVELTELMRRATPEQLAALAAKFNDAPTDARTLGGMAVFFQNWAELDPQNALIGAFKLNDVTFRKLAARAVVNSISPSAAPGLIDYLTKHPDKDLMSECKEWFLGQLVESWSNLDPEASSKFMDDLGDTKNELNIPVRNEIAYNWATLNPSAALDWIGKQKGKDFVDLTNLYDAAIRGWCLKDLNAAATYVRQHLDEPVGADSVSSVAQALFDHNVDDATSWIGRLPNGDQRTEAESTIARTWSQKDPAAAAKWLTTLPASEQTDLVRTIARNWIQANWQEASQWIGTLTGDVRDTALVSAVNRDGATEAESLSLAFSIGNPEMQDTTIENVIRSWSYRDPDAAENWVKGNGLSPERQQKLLSVISESRAAATEATNERVIITD